MKGFYCNAKGIRPRADCHVHRCLANGYKRIVQGWKTLHAFRMAWDY